MIQLNLLPDVKLEYIRAQRSRRLLLSVAILASIISVATLVILLSYGGIQKKHLSDLTRDINDESSQLQKQPNITTILTVQNQLQRLTELHAGKPAASRLFDYMNNVTPDQVSITSLNNDFVAKVTTITGTADALSSVNKYVDTLKFTSYKTDGDTTKKPAFSNVVLSTFALTGTTSKTPVVAVAQPANYTITLAYDPIIFDITKKISLIVPNLITTRAGSIQPNDLFKASAAATPATAANGGKK